MKKIYLFTLFALVLAIAGPAFSNGFIKGTPDIKSLGVMAFGPEGILFIGDSQSAAVFALDLQDNTPSTTAEALEVLDIDGKIGGLLGAPAEQIWIHDLAVNPISQNAYLTVTRGRGKDAVHVLLRVMPDGKIENVSLENILFAKKEISNPISMEAKSRRGGSMRGQAITDLAYSQGELFIAGLSNEEFASTLRVASFPFDKNEIATSVEIYHASHRKYETHSPIRTLMAYQLNKTPHILASYTCTPLVTFPIAKIKEGAHLMGTTVAELGSRNTPLDMIAYQSGGKEYILLANSSRALMKIDPKNIETQTGITEPVPERGGTVGVPFTATNLSNAQQMDNLNANHVVVIQKMDSGSLNLKSLEKGQL